MTERGSTRALSRDRRAQMPFSLIAIVLIIVSSLSAALITDLRDGSQEVSLTREEIERMDELSLDAQGQVQEMAWRSLLSACTGDSLNESAISSRFERELGQGIDSAYPISRSGMDVEANVSGVKLSFLRLPLDQDLAGDIFTDKYVPAYIGLAGSIIIKVSSANGNLSRDYPVEDQGKVPLPLLNDRMKGFERSVSDGLGDLSSMVNYMLESLAAYRSVQGWGSSVLGEEGLAETITNRDLVNAIDLGLIVLQMKHFRQATPCYGMSTDVLDGDGCWQFVEDGLREGGTVDPADIFLGLYGYDQLDWRKVFSQALSSAIERLSLRWMEYIGLVKLIEIAEKAGEAVFFFANDLIDQTFDVDLAEENFKDWLEETFDKAGIPEEVYRYLGKGVPDGSINVDEIVIQLADAEGQPMPIAVGGPVTLDIPQTDVLAWEGWGEFHEQYKKGTLEILNAIRKEIAAVSEQISRSMFLPPTELVLDPRDGVSLLDEIKASLSIALDHKDTWIRAAMSAAESKVMTADPLAEATKAEFLENRDVILHRQEALGYMVSSAAEQLLSSALTNREGADIPWDENLKLLEGLIVGDAAWGANELIEWTFDVHAQFLQEFFMAGLSQGSSSGTVTSWMADVISRTGDPYAGISVVLSDDVSQMLWEMSNGMRVRGNQMEVVLPASPYFSLLGPDGRSHQESLRVKITYPNEGSLGSWFSSSILSPCDYQGSPDSGVQIHDTDVLDAKAASYQSVWKIAFSGRVAVSLAPGGEIGQVLPAKLERQLGLDSELTVAVLTGHALMGVSYVNVNTFGQQLSEIIDSLLRPLQEGLGTLTSYLRSAYRLIRGAINDLVEMGRDVLEALSALLGSMVEELQDFIRSAMSIVESKVARMLLDILGERSVTLCFLGVDMTVKLNPKDLDYKEVGVPASISLAFKTDECRIDVTTRLIKGQGNLSLLTNASLRGEDWAVSMVVDPFMDVFRHMVEVRGLVDGACVELVMPEIVSYRKVSFSLSDIPGVGALLSNIPLPIPGLKGVVNAGVYIKVLEGRTDQVVINEYELNPAGEDAGREWVELYNPTTEAVDLTGWTIETRHGVQGSGSLSGIMMPRTRMVYHFPGQALDNIGEGFPFEESLVLRDERGRRVDSAPFSTDCWNDDRTWQRAKDGADRWEFKSGSRGASNGRDLFSILDLDTVEQVYFAAVTESLYQLSSGELSMEALAMTIETALLRMLERLTANILDKEVVAGLFVEVAVSEASSTAKSGMRMEVIWRCGTLRDALHDLASSARPLTLSLGNPFQAYLDGLPSANGIWLAMSAFGAVGVPKMMCAPGYSTEVRYQASVAVDLGVLAMVFGQRTSGWSMEAGVKITGVPATAVPMFKAPYGTTLDIWLCKVTVQGVVR
ncbi:MAG: lamin tail domain-containing protein [Methanomassiliicoccales archaeon]